MLRKSEKQLKRISTKTILILSFAPSLNIAVLGSDTKEAKVFPPTVIQNPLLRKHFTERFLSIHGGVQNLRHPSQFVEEFISRQIEDLVNRIEVKLRDLKDFSAELKLLRKHLVQGTKIDTKFKISWKMTMSRISKSSRELHKSLSVIFLDLPSKNEYKARIIRDPVNTHYKYEFNYLAKQLDLARHGIESYFFGQEETIHFRNLRYTNMLICLYHAQKLAQRLHKEF